jgi:LPXTG-site transpeptidase (sortase) family protein
MASTKIVKVKQKKLKRPYTKSSKELFSKPTKASAKVGLHFLNHFKFSSVISKKIKQTIALFLVRLSSVLLIFLGSAFIFLGSTYSLGLDWSKPFIEPETQTIEKDIKSKPQALFIPKLAKTLDVSEGNIVEDRWIISPTGVSHYTDSALPGEGNTVLYGHNLKNILGDMYLLNQGDSVYLILDSGDFIEYKVYETKEVTPYAVEILNPTQDSKLTMYTCSGFLDQARFVVFSQEVKRS